MDLKWITANSGLVAGLGIVNKVDINKFDKFLDHIMTARRSGKIFTETELIKLEKILRLSASEVALLVKTTNYLLKRMCKYILKPTNLLEDLVQELKVNEDKACTVLKYWSQTVNESINELDIGNLGNIDTVTDVEWQLNIELCSDTSKNTKVPNAVLKLELEGIKQNLILNLPHHELYGLFQQLGSIQLELDNLDK